MKTEKHSTRAVIDIKGQINPKDSFKALLVVYLPQVIAATGVLLAGLAALIMAIKN